MIGTSRAMGRSKTPESVTTSAAAATGTVRGIGALGGGGSGSPGRERIGRSRASQGFAGVMRQCSKPRGGGTGWLFDLNRCPQNSPTNRGNQPPEPLSIPARGTSSMCGLVHQVCTVRPNSEGMMLGSVPRAHEAGQIPPPRCPQNSPTHGVHPKGSRWLSRPG
jgi:hypothetical protein